MANTSPIPPLVARLLPPAQYEHILLYADYYKPDIDRLAQIVSAIPRLGGSHTDKADVFFLHYYTGATDYFISEYDGYNTLYGKVRFAMYQPPSTDYQQFSLPELKSNNFMCLDFSWGSTNN